MILLGIVFCIIVLFVSSLFILSLIIGRNDIADVAWGPGIALVAWSAWYFGGQPHSFTHILILGAITLWGVRLGVRIFLKNRKKGEDKRYARWRDAWGQWFLVRSYLQIFLLQGFLMIVVGSLAVFAVLYIPSTYTSSIFTYAGLTVWMIGFFFESVSDWQLDSFLAHRDHKAQLMRSGLWQYSRHPNYFGEVTMWWGLWIMVATAPFGPIALLSPLTISTLILYVSGIPLLEAGFKKYPEWPAYQRTTSVFIPWWPKQ